MKKFLIALALLVGTTAVAQEKDVTKFLGIPVDGFKSEMIQKLKEKGFVPSSNDTLEGEFNGTSVSLSVVTNNNKVYRIFIADKHTKNETDIKIRFNNLCSQFENNKRYISIGEQTISEDDDISYNMSVKNKRYEAVFYQKALSESSSSFDKQVWFMIDEFFGSYRIIMFYDNALNQANGEDL